MIYCHHVILIVTIIITILIVITIFNILFGEWAGVIQQQSSDLGDVTGAAGHHHHDFRAISPWVPGL